MSLFDYIAIGLGLCFFASITWYRIEYGIYAIILLLPSYLIRISIAGFPTTFLELALLLLFITWLFKDGAWRRINVRWRRTKTTYNIIPKHYRLPLALLLISSFIAMVISPNQPHAFGIFKAYFLEPVAFLLVFSYEIKERRQIELVFRMLGILTVGIGLIALVQYYTGFGISNPFWADPAHRRVTTFFGYPNANSLFVGPIIGLYIGYLFKKDAIVPQLFKIAVILCGVVTIIAAKSMGAIVALGCAILVLILYQYNKWRIVIISLTAFAVLGFFLMPRIQQEVFRLADTIPRNYLSLSSSSLEIRINQWRETVAYLNDHPIIGAGLANYQQAIRPYHTYPFLEIYLYPHTIVLNFWTELGILGCITFLLLCWSIIRTIHMALTDSYVSGNSRILGLGLMLAWIMYVVHGLVDVPYFKNDLAVLTMILIGCTMYIDTTLRALNEHHKKSW